MIRIELDAVAARAVQRELRRYAEKKHKNGEEVIMELASEVAKGLASRVQPWGLKVGKMKKFQGSIKKQARRAIRNANVVGDAGMAKIAHKTRRRSDGQVPVGLRTAGQFKQTPITIQDAINHADKKAKVAGAAKGAWLDCARKCWRAVKFPKFFNNLLDHGTVSKSGRGFNTKVSITNNLGYIRKTMTNSDIQTAIKNGYNAMFAKIKRALR